MMFFTQLFTSKRGPLAQIWLAAHWERKLTKAHVFECNLEKTIRDIISPKMKIGLRTSSHLLIGAVRIYSRKAKYLLADCNDALARIQMAFRPGQTDLPEEGLEAALKAITLIEDFTAFDGPMLPQPSFDIDVIDSFSLNQCRPEEITMKEDFGSSFLNLADIGDESQGHQNGLLDMSFHSLTHNGDAFGDEDIGGFDLIDLLTISSDQPESICFNPEEPQNESPESSALNNQHDADQRARVQVESSTLNETTLVSNVEKAFTLEPVAITPNSEKKRGRRKRRLVVDEVKELSDNAIREQLYDSSDLVAPFDMAPPTRQLMQWKEGGGADKLFAQPCSTVVNPGIQELFAKSIFQVKSSGVSEEVEEMRLNEQEVQRDTSALTADISLVDSSVHGEKMPNTELMLLDHTNNNLRESLSHSELTQDGSRSESTHPELPSEDSMFVHPSNIPQEETQSSSMNTQSMLDTQVFEQRRIIRRAQKLLDILKNQSSDATFSLKALCAGGTRMQAASTFLCFLVLTKQQTLHLHQSGPYEDIVATPGPKFYN